MKDRWRRGALGWRWQEAGQHARVRAPEADAGTTA